MRVLRMRVIESWWTTRLDTYQQSRRSEDCPTSENCESRLM